MTTNPNAELLAEITAKLKAELARDFDAEAKDSPTWSTVSEVDSAKQPERIADLVRAMRDLTEVSALAEPITLMPEDDLDLAALELMARTDAMTTGQRQAFAAALEEFGLLEAWNTLDQALSDARGDGGE